MNDNINYDLVKKKKEEEKGNNKYLEVDEKPISAITNGFEAISFAEYLLDITQRYNT